MVFTWDETDVEEKKTTTLKLGSLVVGLLRKQKRPDSVLITDEEIRFSLVDGAFSHNKWELERYMHDLVRPCLKPGGKIYITDDFNMQLYDIYT